MKNPKDCRKPVEQSEKDIDVIKVSEMEAILSYGVMMTPALVLDGKIKCSGTIATVEKIIEWINEIKK